MKVVGIIAEYNPFHNGHAYQLSYAREVLGADAVVVVMSGDFTQRGSVAVFDKDTRARMALENGADIVFELPVFCACASAEFFAQGAVRTLHDCGIVDTLLFGSEWDDISLFEQAAELLLAEDAGFSLCLKDALSSGCSFAKARSLALEAHLPKEFLQQPNNILGVEYVKAIRRFGSDIRPVCMKRQGSQYHDKKGNGCYISASGLRDVLNAKNVSQLPCYVPGNTLSLYQSHLKTEDLLFDEDLSLPLHQRLLEQDDFSHIMDCSSDLSNKICKQRDSFLDFPQFCSQLKSKDLTYTRISRLLCHILLDIRQDQFFEYHSMAHTPYLRLRGFTKNGSGLLSEIKAKGRAPIITSPTQGEKVLDEASLSILKKDLYVSDIYRMMRTAKTHQCYPTEYTKKNELCNL